MQKSFAATVLRNSGWGVLAQFAIKIFSFIFSILVIRNLGAEDYGQYAAILAFGATFAIIADLGIAPYAVRQIARIRSEADESLKVSALYSQIVSLRFVLSLVTIVTVTGIAWVTGRPPWMIAAIFFSLIGFILYAFQGSAEALLSGFERLDIVSGARILSQFAFVVLGALALYSGTGYWGLIAASLLSTSLLAWICWRGTRFLNLEKVRFTTINWQDLVKRSLPFGIIGLALGFSYKFDSILLSIFSGDLETGYYNAAYNLVFSAVVFSNAFNTALYPSLTREVAKTPEKLARIAERSFRYLMLLALPIAVGGSILASQIVNFLYPEDFNSSVLVLQIIIWTVPLMYASEFLGYIVLITEREKLVAKAVIVSTTFNILLNLWLIPQYGFLAAAVMTVLTETVLVMQHLWNLRALLREMKLHIAIMHPLIAALVMGGVLLLISKQLPLFANVAIGAGVYGIVFLMIGGFSSTEILSFRTSIMALMGGRK